MTPGVYVLLIELERSGSHAIGRLGNVDFPAGFYGYVGSALNGLEGRLKRHLRQEKKLHWHIDYLLKKARISNIFYAETPAGSRFPEQPPRVECQIARSLAQYFEFAKGFGCSDCRCPSHLFYSKNLKVMNRKISGAFRSSSLRAILLQNCYENM